MGRHPSSSGAYQANTRVAYGVTETSLGYRGAEGGLPRYIDFTAGRPSPAELIAVTSTEYGSPH